MLAARITLPHFSVSSAISFPKSAGEPAIGNATGLWTLRLPNFGYLKNHRAETCAGFVDTQRRLLAAASQRDDRALERPSNLTGGAAGKVVPKLLTGGIQSRGSLSVWRPDGDDAFTLRITKKGLRGLDCGSTSSLD
jgi:hypothetical protein